MIKLSKREKTGIAMAIFPIIIVCAIATYQIKTWWILPLFLGFTILTTIYCYYMWKFLGNIPDKNTIP